MASRLLKVAYWMLIAIGASYAAWRGWIWRGYTDFDVYRAAGMRAVDYVRGANPVFAINDGETSPFRYAPVFSWIFAPFALIPENVSRSLWMSLQWGVYALALQMVHTSLRLNPYQRLAILIGTLRFAVDNSNIGQASALLALWLIISALRPKQWLGSFSHAAASLLKLQPMVLALIPIWNKNYRGILQLGAALLILISLSALSLGSESFRLWIQLVLKAESVLDPSTIGNQSLYGAFVRVFSSKDSARIAFGAVLIATAVYTSQCWRKTRWDTLTGWALGLGFLPIFGILTWKNTYLTWILPLAFFVRSNPRLTWAIALAFVLPSQGLLGSDANGWALRVGLLPWTALASMMLYARSLRGPSPSSH